jgi:2-phosphosulfolactate phosphatase
MKIETILSPAELPALARRDWRGTACVVFDILRATSTFVTTLHRGAEKIIPVGEISEAVALRKKDAGILLAGERDGVRIRAAQSSGTDFDFGNSPREFISEKIHGKTIASTTTNGTRALRACAGADAVLAGSFLNLSATAEFLRVKNFETVLLICAGTGEGVALEDVLAAGALVESLCGGTLTPALSLPKGEGEKNRASFEIKSALCKSSLFHLSDSSLIALKTFAEMKTDLATAIGSSQNGRRLLAIPELRDDMAFCAQRDVFNLVVKMDADGALRIAR